MSAGVRLSKVAFDGEQARQAGRRLYMCRHQGRAADLTLAETAAQHERDVALQDKYAVRWLTYYVNAEGSTNFCLAESPSQEAVEACHREAHGALRAYRVTEVDWAAVEAFLGAVLTPDQGYPWGESPVRSIAVLSLANPLGLTLRVGSRQARAIFDELLELAAGSMGVADPSQVEHTPTAIITSFASADRAVASALAIVEQMQARAPVRAGVSLGEPLSTFGSLFGATVQLAYDLSLQAAPGSVLMSDEVRAALAAPCPAASEQSGQLSEREHEVLRLLAGGRSNQEIAAQLVIGPGTFDEQVANILNKTGTSNPTEAVAFGYRERLI